MTWRDCKHEDSYRDEEIKLRLFGCIVTSYLALAGDKIGLFYTMDKLMERQLVEQDSATLLEMMQSAGINVRLNQSVKGFTKSNNKIQVTANYNLAEFDGFIVSCGFKPRTELAEKAGPDTGRGIITNQYLQTNDENINVLSDIAELPNGKLYAFIKFIRHQALWLANYLSKQEKQPRTPAEFNPFAKIENFEASYPYLF